MSDIVVTREEVGYRGGAGGVDIFVPSRAIQLAGKPKLLSKFWYALLAFMVFYGALFLYIQSREGVDQALGALVLLLMLAPLIMLGGGRRIGSALGRGFALRARSPSTLSSRTQASTRVGRFTARIRGSHWDRQTTVRSMKTVR